VLVDRKVLHDPVVALILFEAASLEEVAVGTAGVQPYLLLLSIPPVLVPDGVGGRNYFSFLVAHVTYLHCRFSLDG
jgi:hypothetical protein